MSEKLPPGKYVIAISGGVDSVALLHMLVPLPGVDLVVAHFDHGIRPDSATDASFVSDLAQQYGLPFITERAELGPGASENTARQARYGFLRRAVQQSGATAMITAHHQDDLLETAIFNLLRGTGRRGLTSLRSTSEIRRPLLHLPKAELINYALQYGLSWREDSTNYDQQYTRNYIRHQVLVRFDAGARQQLLSLIARLTALNIEIDGLLEEMLTQQDTGLRRQWFRGLPDDVAGEVMAAFLRQNQLPSFDRPCIERLVACAKTKVTGKQADVYNKRRLLVTKTQLVLT